MAVSIVMAEFTHDRMTLRLNDGRWLSIPLHYSPRLQGAKPIQLMYFELPPRAFTGLS